jgi:hypothetical protein
VKPKLGIVLILVITPRISWDSAVRSMIPSTIRSLWGNGLKRAADLKTPTQALGKTPGSAGGSEGSVLPLHDVASGTGPKTCGSVGGVGCSLRISASPRHCRLRVFFWAEMIPSEFVNLANTKGRETLPQTEGLETALRNKFEIFVRFILYCHPKMKEARG